MPIDDMHFVDAPPSERLARRALTQEVISAPANPATYQFDLLASDFTGETSFVAVRTPELPPLPQTPAAQGLPARIETPPKPMASAAPADMPAPAIATFAPTTGQTAQSPPAAEPVLAQAAELNDGEGEGPMFSAMDGGGECDCCCTPTVRITAIDPTASAWSRYGGAHGTSTGAFEVRRTGDVSESLTVWFTVLPESTAVPGSDYEPLSGYVDIPAGQRNAGILVEPLDSANENASKSVIIQLDWSPDYFGEGAFASVTINESISGEFGTIHNSWLIPEVSISGLDPYAAELPDEVSTGLYLVNRLSVTEISSSEPGGEEPPQFDTYTNTNAVTVSYTVWQEPNQISGDYDNLPGTVNLPQGVFGASIVLTPIDDELFESPEAITITLTPSSSYETSFSSPATVLIQDEESNEAPIAVNDVYAMSVEDEVLNVPADGVLCNDLSFGDGELTASFESPPSGITPYDTPPQFGDVEVHADGSFIYTPTAEIRETGGTDTFSYHANLTNALGRQWSIGWVTVHVVKVDLQMAGVPDADEESPGGYVPLNANNSAEWPLVNEIPTSPNGTVMFDKDHSPLRNQIGQLIDDPDLVQMSIAVTPNIGLPGFFVLSHESIGGDRARVELWKERSKESNAAGAYNQANLPSTFYVEGTVFGENLRTIQIKLVYLFIDFCGVPIDAGADRVIASVTPVTRLFTIDTDGAAGVSLLSRTQTVPFQGGLVSFSLGMDSVQANQPNVIGLGGRFRSTLHRNGLTGNPAYVENMLEVVNFGPGMTFGPFQGEPAIPNRAMVLAAVYGIPAGPRQQSIVEMNAANPAAPYTVNAPKGFQPLPAPQFPRLDMGQAQVPMPPDYAGHFEILPDIDDPNKLLVLAKDGPGTLSPFWPKGAINPAPGTTQAYRLTSLDIEFRLRVWLSWRYDDGTRYELGWRDWNVVFRATSNAGVNFPGSNPPHPWIGLNTIVAGSGTFSPGPTTWAENPKPVVDEPTFNWSIVLR